MWDQINNYVLNVVILAMFWVAHGLVKTNALLCVNLAEAYWNLGIWLRYHDEPVRSKEMMEMGNVWRSQIHKVGNVRAVLSVGFWAFALVLIFRTVRLLW